MDIKRLFNKLQHYDSKLYESPGNCTSFRSIKFLNENLIDLDPCILYICKASYLKNVLSQIHLANIVCVKDIEIPKKLLESTSANVIILGKIIELTALFNEVYDILFVNQTLSDGSEMISDNFLQKNQFGDIYDITEIAYSILSNPIVISNLDGVIFANKNITNIPNLTDQMFNNSFKINSPEFACVSEHFKNHNTYMLSKDILGTNFNIIIGKIIENKQVSAYMLLFEFEKSFSEIDVEVVSQMCKVLSFEMETKVSNQISKKNILFEKLIINLLNETIYNNEIINAWINSLNISLKKDFYILTINIKQINSKLTCLNSLKGLIEKSLPDSKLVMYAGNYVLFINTTKTDFSNIKNLSPIIDIMAKYKLYGGLSRCFYSLSQLSYYYKQSLKAIEFGMINSKTDYLYTYDNYVIYHMLDMLPRSIDVKEFCHPKLLELLEYDSKNNTQYTYTLYVVLLAKGKQVDASNILHVHRSTMVYRMEKIEELTGLSPYDLKDIVLLYFSFIILKMLNKLDPEIYTGIF
ncbi:MAG: PucR family transcriptional regulator [Sedimentibacter sp.]